MKSAITFLVIVISMSLSQEDGVITRLGVEHSYWMAFLLAGTITAIIRERPMSVAIVVCALSIVANAPSYGDLFGLERDIVTAGMLALVLGPFIANALD